MAAKDYQAIRIGSISGDSQTPFDTYLQVGSRYVLYCRNGDFIDGDRLNRLKQKNIANLYILKSDMSAYEAYTKRNADAAYSHAAGTTIEVRADAIVVYNCSLIERLFSDLTNEDTYLELKSSSRRFLDFVCMEQEGLRALMNVPNPDLKISQHGVRVAALAVALAQAMKWVDNNRPVHLMVMGAFMHDLEFANSGFDYRRTLASFSVEDATVYRSHPMAGAKRLQEIPHMESLVQQIILQHEEHADGSGFPKGLKEDEMDPSVLFVGAANAFDRLITFENREPKDALKALLIDKMGSYPLPLLQALQNLLKSRGLVA